LIVGFVFVIEGSGDAFEHLLEANDNVLENPLVESHLIKRWNMNLYEDHHIYSEFFTTTKAYIE